MAGRAIRSITFGRAAVAPEVRLAACPSVVPLLSLSLRRKKMSDNIYVFSILPNFKIYEKANYFFIFG
jgi:hypothetical protein